MPEHTIAPVRVARHSNRTVDPTHPLPCSPLRSRGLAEQCHCSGYTFLSVTLKPFALGTLRPPTGYTTELANAQRRRFDTQPLEQTDHPESLGPVCMPMCHARFGLHGRNTAPTGTVRLTLSILRRPRRASAARRNNQCRHQRDGSSKLFAARTSSRPCPEFMSKGVREPQCQ